MSLSLSHISCGVIELYKLSNYYYIERFVRTNEIINTDTLIEEVKDQKGLIGAAKKKDQ